MILRPPMLYSSIRPCRPHESTQHSQKLHRLLNRLDIIVRRRGQTITPDKNPESCGPKRLEGILREYDLAVLPA